MQWNARRRLAELCPSTTRSMTEKLLCVLAVYVVRAHWFWTTGWRASVTNDDLSWLLASDHFYSSSG
jgi:hypothetical protein